MQNENPNLTLHINGEEKRMGSNSMVENIKPSLIEPGRSGERYAVFIFPEKYLAVYETFELEVGPCEDLKMLFKEKTLRFDIPQK